MFAIVATFSRFQLNNAGQCTEMFWRLATSQLFWSDKSSIILHSLTQDNYKPQRISSGQESINPLSSYIPSFYLANAIQFYLPNTHLWTESKKLKENNEICLTYHFYYLHINWHQERTNSLNRCGFVILLRLNRITPDIIEGLLVIMDGFAAFSSLLFI